MPCETVRLPGGGAAIVCHRGRRRVQRCWVPLCEDPATRQCDFPIGPGKTCDRYLCAAHAVPQGGGRDYCPDHPGQSQKPATRPAERQGDLFHGQ